MLKLVEKLKTYKEFIKSYFLKFTKKLKTYIKWAKNFNFQLLKIKKEEYHNFNLLTFLKKLKNYNFYYFSIIIIYNFFSFFFLNMLLDIIFLILLEEDGISLITSFIIFIYVLYKYPKNLIWIFLFAFLILLFKVYILNQVKPQGGMFYLFSRIIDFFFGFNIIEMLEDSNKKDENKKYISIFIYLTFLTFIIYKIYKYWNFKPDKGSDSNIKNDYVIVSNEDVNSSSSSKSSSSVNSEYENIDLTDSIIFNSNNVNINLTDHEDKHIEDKHININLTENKNNEYENVDLTDSIIFNSNNVNINLTENKNNEDEHVNINLTDSIIFNSKNDENKNNDELDELFDNLYSNSEFENINLTDSIIFNSKNDENKNDDDENVNIDLTESIIFHRDLTENKNNEYENVDLTDSIILYSKNKKDEYENVNIDLTESIIFHSEFENINLKDIKNNSHLNFNNINVDIDLTNVKPKKPEKISFEYNNIAFPEGDLFLSNKKTKETIKISNNNTGIITISNEYGATINIVNQKNLIVSNCIDTGVVTLSLYDNDKHDENSIMGFIEILNIPGYGLQILDTDYFFMNPASTIVYKPDLRYLTDRDLYNLNQYFLKYKAINDENSYNQNLLKETLEIKGILMNKQKNYLDITKNSENINFKSHNEFVNYINKFITFCNNYDLKFKNLIEQENNILKILNYKQKIIYNKFYLNYFNEVLNIVCKHDEKNLKIIIKSKALLEKMRRYDYIINTESLMGIVGIELLMFRFFYYTTRDDYFFTIVNYDIDTFIKLKFPYLNKENLNNSIKKFDKKNLRHSICVDNLEKNVILKELRQDHLNNLNILSVEENIKLNSIINIKTKVKIGNKIKFDCDNNQKYKNLFEIREKNKMIDFYNIKKNIKSFILDSENNVVKTHNLKDQLMLEIKTFDKTQLKHVVPKVKTLEEILEFFF